MGLDLAMILPSLFTLITAVAARVCGSSAVSVSRPIAQTGSYLGRLTSCSYMPSRV